jgi:hypothetical protein
MPKTATAPPPGHALRLTIWLLLLIVLAVFAVVREAADFSRRPAAAPPTRPPAGTFDLQALADPPEPEADAEQPDVQKAQPPAPVAAKTRRLKPGETELCGIGVVQADEDDPQGLRHIPEAVRMQAFERLHIHMAAHADVQVRAAGLLLRARRSIDGDALARTVEEDAACRRAQSMGFQETGEFCTGALGQAEAALLEAAAPAIDALARLAAVSRDRAVFAMAFDACHGGGLSYRTSEGGCQLVTAEDWSRADPGNAVPWLHLARQAMARGETEAADAAMARAAAAGVSDDHGAALPGLVLGALPATMPPIERTAVTAEVLALSVSSAAPYHDAVTAYCSERALGDAARARTCEAMAGTLLNGGRSSADTLAGVQLAERLGWPAERTSTLMLRQQSALDAATGFSARNSPLGCEGLQRAQSLAEREFAARRVRNPR